MNTFTLAPDLQSDAVEHHLIRARDAVRLAISFSRQVEANGWQLNQDQIDYMRDCAAQSRVDARKHIRLAGLAGWTRMSARRAA